MAAFLVAEDALTRRVVGYAGLMVMADEGYITNVAVFPEQRRRGIAGQLIEVFCDFARGNHLAFLTLEVRPSNAAAISPAFRRLGGHLASTQFLPELAWATRGTERSMTCSISSVSRRSTCSRSDAGHSTISSSCTCMRSRARSPSRFS